MNKKSKSWVIIALIVMFFLVVMAIYFQYRGRDLRDVIEIPNISVPNFSYEDVSQDFTVANWNLQIFGDTKASDAFLLFNYMAVISDYDIIFVQEIRDKDGSSFRKLCLLLNGYECEISSRAGRSTSKEQYGIIYKDYIDLVELEDYNPDKFDRWERPPIKATFNVSGYLFTAYNIHTKPSDVPNEMEYLEDVIEKEEGNVILLGDLNADCDYYNPVKEDDFDTWNWIIKDEEDTTVGTTDCAYDRIIINDNMFPEYIDGGVREEKISKELSDHYVVYIKLNKKDS
jgi:hypothetical protein